MLEIAPNNQIKSLLIDVSEEIENKNLKKFVSTTLNLNNIVLNKNDFLYINFISEINKYQILIFPKEFKYMVFQIFEQLYIDKNINKYDLYLTESFFCLYKNGSFYYSQKLESKVIIEDLISYLNKIFSIKIDSYQFIDEFQQKKLEKKYLESNEKNIIQNFNIKNSHSLKIYLLYIFLLFSFCAVVFENKLENSQKEDSEINIKNDFEKLKKEHLFNSFSNFFNELFLIFVKYDFDLESFEYKENSLKIVFSSSLKTNIYYFFNEIKEKLISQEISYLEKEELYKAVVYVKSIR
jgi:hypothetical protein